MSAIYAFVGAAAYITHRAGVIMISESASRIDALCVAHAVMRMQGIFFSKSFHDVQNIGPVHGCPALFMLGSQLNEAANYVKHLDFSFTNVQA